jgi:hypothetical protein
MHQEIRDVPERARRTPEDPEQTFPTGAVDRFSNTGGS